jgi:acetolactate synthase-1/2/3 large subunit
VANPSVPVVSITGDGGMSSCLSALITAAEYGIAAIWVVLNNGVYQSIMGLQQQHFSRTLGTVFWEGGPNARRTDFAGVARGLGIDARTVKKPDELREALDWAATLNRPVLLDVLTDPQAFPPAAGFWDVHEIYNGTQTAGVPA